MPFVLFLRGLVLVLIAFAITSYVITGSLWTTLVQTVICALLIQVGYFIAVLFLVWRGDKKSPDIGGVQAGDPAKPVDQASASKSRLPGLTRSRHP